MQAREPKLPELPTATKLVLLNATSSVPVASVLPDELTGGHAVVELLVDAGQTSQIALLGYDHSFARETFRSETVSRRRRGIDEAMQAHGLRFMCEESIAVWEPHGGYVATRRILASHPDVRSILCLNDQVAFGAHQAITERGLGVPRDIALVSFDVDAIAAYLHPGLTTVALPHEEMGARAVELLLTDAGPGEVRIPMPVVRRGSIQGSLRTVTALLHGGNSGFNNEPHPESTSSGRGWRDAEGDLQTCRGSRHGSTDCPSRRRTPSSGPRRASARSPRLARSDLG